MMNYRRSISIVVLILSILLAACQPAAPSPESTLAPTDVLVVEISTPTSQPLPPAPTQARPTAMPCLIDYSRQPLSGPNNTTRDGETIYTLSPDEFQALLTESGIQSFCVPVEAGAPFIQSDWNAVKGTALTGRMLVVSFDNWREVTLVFASYDFTAGTEYDPFASSQDWEAIKKANQPGFMRIYTSSICFGTCGVFKTYVFPREQNYVALTLYLGAFEAGQALDTQVAQFNAGQFPEELQPASQRLDGMARELSLIPGYQYSRPQPIGDHLVLTAEGQAYSLAFGSGGLRLAAGYQDPQSVIVWNMDTAIKYGQGNPKKLALPSFDPPIAILSLAYSSDSLYLAAGTSNGGRVLTWHAAQLLNDNGEPTVLTPEQTGMDPQKTFESRVAFAPQSSILAIIYNPYTPDGAVVLWDVQNNQLKQTLPATYAYILAFSPDGKRVATGRTNGAVQVWDVETGEILQTLAGNEVGVTGLSFSPDGATLAGVQIDGTITLWNGNDYTLQHYLRAPSDQVYGASFSPDGKILAVGTAQGQVLLLDLEGGEPRTLNAGQGVIYQVSFSPDGKLLAATDTKAGVILFRIQE